MGGLGAFNLFCLLREGTWGTWIAGRYLALRTEEVRPVQIIIYLLAGTLPTRVLLKERDVSDWSLVQCNQQIFS